MNWLGDRNQEWLPGIGNGADHRVLLTTSDRLLAVGGDGMPLLVTVDDPLISPHQPHLLGTLDGVSYYGVRCPKIAGLSYEPLEAGADSTK